MQNSFIDRLSKKQKIEDSVVQIFNENGLSDAEIIEYCKALTRKSISNMMSVVFTDWFYSLLLQYLTLKDIANFDSAVCNRKIRSQWLESLGKYTSSVSIKIFDKVIWSDRLINWINLRNLHFCQLMIDDKHSEI